MENRSKFGIMGQLKAVEEGSRPPRDDSSLGSEALNNARQFFSGRCFQGGQKGSPRSTEEWLSRQTQIVPEHGKEKRRAHSRCL